jgi:hypothetical protein
MIVNVLRRGTKDVRRRRQWVVDVTEPRGSALECTTWRSVNWAAKEKVGNHVCCLYVSNLTKLWQEQSGSRMLLPGHGITAAPLLQAAFCPTFGSVRWTRKGESKRAEYNRIDRRAGHGCRSLLVKVHCAHRHISSSHTSHGSVVVNLQLHFPSNSFLGTCYASSVRGLYTKPIWLHRS